MAIQPARARPELPNAEVVKRHDVTSDLLILRLHPQAPYAFVPGQYCTIGLEGIERPYSIVSAPHEPELELFIEYVPEGELTQRLWRLGPGDVVSFRPRAKGAFTRTPGVASHLMIATVTGIAPFVSMLRDADHRAQRDVRFFVLHGASYQDELGYREELEGLVARRPELLTYIPTVSRPEDERNRGWHGTVGRVNMLVEPCLDHLGISAATTAAYACGHPRMIADVTRRLAPRGFRVRGERYWPE